MSKPLKIFLVTFNKNSTFTTAAVGSNARDYASMFFNEKCDLFIMQNCRMYNNGNNENTAGSITRRYDSLSAVSTSLGNIQSTTGWFPPYFFEAIQLQETTNAFTNWLCDKFSMSTSVSFIIENTLWFAPPNQPSGLPADTTCGVHFTTFNNLSGQKIGIGSYSQLGTFGETRQFTGFVAVMNFILSTIGNLPFILCCNLSFINPQIISAWDSISNKEGCEIYSLTNPILSSVEPQNYNDTLIEGGYYIISRGLDLTLDFPPCAAFRVPPSFPIREWPPVIITINNFIIKNKNTTNYYNSTSKYFCPPGYLLNALNV